VLRLRYILRLGWGISVADGLLDFIFIVMLVVFFAVPPYFCGRFPFESFVVMPFEFFERPKGVSYDSEQRESTSEGMAASLCAPDHPCHRELISIFAILRQKLVRVE
jgi:hypothetical protein